MFNANLRRGLRISTTPVSFFLPLLEGDACKTLNWPMGQKQLVSTWVFTHAAQQGVVGERGVLVTAQLSGARPRAGSFRQAAERPESRQAPGELALR